MPTATTLGQAGLQGWREKVADGIAEPVARRAPLERGSGPRPSGGRLLRALGDVRGEDAQRGGARSAPELKRVTALRVITWNVARRSSRLAEQGAVLAGRDPDVIALQEVTETTLPLWRAVLERIGLPHVRASLDTADPSRVPASRRRTGVLLASAVPLGEASSALPVPWTETVVAAVAASAIGPVEINCVHVPNAANGWIKPQTLQAVRAGLEIAPPGARVLCGDLNTPRRELENGEVMSFARDSRGVLRPDRGIAWDEAELGVVPGLREHRLQGRLPLASRLRLARAELDVAAHLRARWRVAPGSPLYLG